MNLFALRTMPRNASLDGTSIGKCGQTMWRLRWRSWDAEACGLIIETYDWNRYLKAVRASIERLNELRQTKGRAA